MNDSQVVSFLQTQIGGKAHECSQNCSCVCLNVHIHENNGEHIRWSGNNQPWMCKKTFKRAIKNIFVCKETGTVHHCTRSCMLTPVPNDDFTLACPVSGIQWDNETEVVRSWKLTSKCVPTITTDKRDPNMFSRDVHGKVQNETVNIQDESCKKNIHDVLQKLVCSHKRKVHELEKFRTGKHNAMKLVHRYIKYSKKKGFTNISTVHSIYLTETFRRRNFLRVMSMYKHKIKEYTERLHPIIVRLWNLFGHPKPFSFEIYIPSILYMLQRGIRVDGTTIIHSEEDFERILPDANTLDIFGIGKSSFTATKNGIRTAIRHILRSTTPEQLKQTLYSKQILH